MSEQPKPKVGYCTGCHQEIPMSFEFHASKGFPCGRVCNVWKYLYTVEAGVLHETSVLTSDTPFIFVEQFAAFLKDRSSCIEVRDKAGQVLFGAPKPSFKLVLWQLIYTGRSQPKENLS